LQIARYDEILSFDKESGIDRPMTIRVLFLTKYASQAASSRMRSYQYIEYFENSEISCDVQPLISNDALGARYKSGRYSFVGLVDKYWKRIGVLISRRRYNFDLDRKRGVAVDASMAREIFAAKRAICAGLRRCHIS